MAQRILLLALLLPLVACSGKAPTPDTPAVVQSYDVYGVIRQLPADHGRELMIQHEDIPGFVNAAGETVGMNAMTMGFPLADNVKLDGFAVGDSVRFSFEVRWGQPGPLRITGIEPR